MSVVFNVDSDSVVHFSERVDMGLRPAICDRYGRRGTLDFSFQDFRTEWNISRSHPRVLGYVVRLAGQRGRC